jgi:RNA polymerase sigma-70 factor (ECF subfamily)
MREDFFSKVTDFFSLNRPRLVRFVESKIEDEPSRDAEDIIMDTMTKIFELSDPNVPVEKAVSYIYSAVRNRIVDALRKRKKPVSIEDFENRISARTFKNEQFESVDMKEKAMKLYEAIDRLKPDERAVVIATEFKDMSFKELSAELNVPVGTLLSRKKRAMDKIRKMMKNGGDYD